MFLTLILLSISLFRSVFHSSNSSILSFVNYIELVYHLRPPCIQLFTYTVDGGDLNLVKIGSFVMREGSDDYIFDNQSGNMLNAIWPSKYNLS